MISVGLVGAGARGKLRAELLASLPNVRFAGVLDQLPERAETLAETFQIPVFTSMNFLLEHVSVLCVATTTIDHFLLAHAAARQGVHVFLEWPPAVSLRECEALVRLTEEAGIEMGVSRPLRFHPLLPLLPTGWHARLIHVRQDVVANILPPGAWPHLLADTLDLCGALAGSRSIQRIDAEKVANTPLVPEALAYGLRFHNGAYAQVCLRFRAAAPFEHVYVAGPHLQAETDLTGESIVLSKTGRGAENAGGSSALSTRTSGATTPLHAELIAFLEAIRSRATPPVTILDGLNTMRLVERLMGKLR